MPKTEFAIAPHITQELQKCPKTWQNYQKLPEIYKRVRIDNIQSWYGIEDNITHNKRLKKFLENTKEGNLYGNWHDNGRLLEE